MLATQTDLEKTLQINFTSDTDAVAQYLLENASAAITTYLDRDIEETVYTGEVYDGPTGSALLLLKSWPVTAIASITENGTLLVYGTDYIWYEDGRVIRIAGDTNVLSLWSAGMQNVVVTYTAGYATVPHAIRDVCARAAARAFEKGAAFASAKDPGVSKESIGDYRVTYDTLLTADLDFVLTRPERQNLDRYKRWL